MTGIILAGGKNSRMGAKKALLNIGGKTIIHNIMAIYEKIFKEIIISTNTPEDYANYNVKLLKDIIPDRGPLGGIYTALLGSKYEYCFITACDMPFINEVIIRYITGFEGFDIVVPMAHGRHEPLFALYSKNCLGIIKEHLDKGNLKLLEVIRSARVKEIEEEELKKIDSGLLALTNVNTPEEFDAALKIEKNVMR